jgi:hypothetical protein
MRRPKIIMAILALGLCGVLAVVFWPEKPEPVYQGKKLSEWFGHIGIAPDAGPVVSQELREAMMVVGTNAIPSYLEWLIYRNSLLKKAELYTAERVRSLSNLGWYPENTQEQRRMWANIGFARLGGKIECAAPKLIRLATLSANVEDTKAALACLGYLGRPSLPYLQMLARNDNQVVRELACLQITNVIRMETDVERWTSLLNQTNLETKRFAGKILMEIGRYPKDESLR